MLSWVRAVIANYQALIDLFFLKAVNAAVICFELRSCSSVQILRSLMNHVRGFTYCMCFAKRVSGDISVITYINIAD